MKDKFNLKKNICSPKNEYSNKLFEEVSEVIRFQKVFLFMLKRRLLLNCLTVAVIRFHRPILVIVVLNI